MPRYERPDHATGTYFEINLEGRVVTTRTGVIGAYSHRSDGHTLYGSDRGREGRRTYKDENAARAAFDKAVVAKRADGFRRVDRPDDLVEQTVDVHRNRELEALVAAAAPGDPSPYLVYADWLQQRGDPRGELIALSHAMHAQSDPREFMAFKQREQAVRFAHERLWLGDVVVAAAARIKLDWKLGFVERARLAVDASQLPLETVLSALLASPCGCAVRVLDLVAPQETDDQAPRLVDQIIAACALLPSPGLRTLRCESRSGVREATLVAFAPHQARLVAAGVGVTEQLY